MIIRYTLNSLDLSSVLLEFTNLITALWLHCFIAGPTKFSITFFHLLVYYLRQHNPPPFPPQKSQQNNLKSVKETLWHGSTRAAALKAL